MNEEPSEGRQWRSFLEATRLPRHPARARAKAAARRGRRVACVVHEEVLAGVAEIGAIAMVKRSLGGEDAAWLHMEDATNPMVVSAMLELAGPFSLHRAYAVLERLSRMPRFRARVVEPALHVGPPTWEPVPDFDLTQHVEHVVLGTPGEASLRAFLGETLSTRLDPTRPLWRAYLVDRPGAGTILLCRVHHAIGDGFALLDVLLSLCSGDRTAIGPDPRMARRLARRRAIFASAEALKRLVTLPTDPKTALRAPLHTDKRVAWSAPVLLTDLKAAARACGATVNDVLAAVLAGGVGRYLGRRKQNEPGLELHAMVPVNLRTAGAPLTLDNRFGIVLLGLPVGIEDPIARVTAVKQRMRLLKDTPEASVAHGLLRAMGWAPPSAADLAASFFGKKASLVLTNVPGPRAQLSLDGVPISRIMFWVPEAARIGLGVSILSYAGEVTIGILSDAALVPDPDVLVGDVHVELAALEAQLRSEGEAHVPATTPPQQDRAPVAPASGVQVVTLER